LVAGGFFGLHMLRRVFAGRLFGALRGVAICLHPLDRDRLCPAFGDANHGGVLGDVWSLGGMVRRRLKVFQSKVGAHVVLQFGGKVLASTEVGCVLDCFGRL
jgi:hypothetical protein